jgi:hypothetical protein
MNLAARRCQGGMRGMSDRGEMRTPTKVLLLAIIRACADILLWLAAPRMCSTTVDDMNRASKVLP